MNRRACEISLRLFTFAALFVLSAKSATEDRARRLFVVLVSWPRQLTNNLVIVSDSQLAVLSLLICQSASRLLLRPHCDGCAGAAKNCQRLPHSEREKEKEKEMAPGGGGTQPLCIVGF